MRAGDSPGARATSQKATRALGFEASGELTSPTITLPKTEMWRSGMMGERVLRCVRVIGGPGGVESLWTHRSHTVCFYTHEFRLLPNH
jgi:hypothetical protein